MPITVLIADDQAMVRAGFGALLDAQEGISVIGQAQDGAEAVALSRRLHPDVVLMDVRMPVMNGIDATRELTTPARGVVHVPKVIVLTTFDIDDYVYEALQAGASGFILKDARPDELSNAVRVVAAGDALLAPSVTRRLIEQFARSAPVKPVEASRLADLTDREREVLTLVARGHSNSEIAGLLFISEQTVKTHVSRIFGKLDLRDRVQAVVLAYDLGLVAPGGAS